MKKIILAENIRSLHNVGAIFRTAESAGWDHIILGGYTGTPPDRRIEKVSLGAEDIVSWEHQASSIDALKNLKAQGATILALEKNQSSTDIFHTPLEPKGEIVLIIGNEVEGVSEDLLKLSDSVLHIPMHGQKESLNVSIACGIALYGVNNAIDAATGSL